jgi:small subunit ribosomal protein S20
VIEWRVALCLYSFTRQARKSATNKQTDPETSGNVISWLTCLEPSILRTRNDTGIRNETPPGSDNQTKGTIQLANIKSQIKRIKTNLKAQERNRAVKSELKTVVRAARAAITAGDKDKAAAAVSTAGRKLDKAVSKGVIHKNQAANRKSALAKASAAL